MSSAHEIYKEVSHNLSIEAKNGEVTAVDTSIECGLAARVIVDGRLGFAYSTRPGSEESEVIAKAKEIAACVSADDGLELPGASKAGRYSFDPTPFKRMTEKEKAEFALAAERSARAYDKRIKGVRKVSYDETLRDTSIKNSLGVNAAFLQGLCSLSMTAIAEENGHSEWASDVEFALDPKLIDPNELGRRTAKRALSYLGGRKVSSRRCACILERDVVGNILGILAPSFFADSVYKKKSPFVGKLGKEIYSKALTITNDPTIDRGNSSVPFDAEGSAARKTLLVEDGVLGAFLSDLSYSKKIECPNSASSVRPQIGQMPKIGFHNLHIAAGRRTMNELKMSMGDGFLVTDVMGLHTANPVTGDFSVGASGFWVENGLNAFSVKGITISGNLHELLRNTSEVGNDLKFWHSTGAPSLLISDISLGGE